MKTYFFAASLLLLSMVCVNQGCKTKTKTNAETQGQQTPETTVVQVDNLLLHADSLQGQTVEVEGICTHICAHGGGKIFLMGSDDTRSIRIEAGEVIGKFKPETVNNIVRVKGRLVEERIDEAYLVRWEEKLAGQTDEKHGNTEAGCASEQKARGEAVATTVRQRIDDFRKRIAERRERDGRDYLSFYHVAADSYTIQ